ncbi:MAG: cysteine hydrolase [Oscillospiraceae bacterium]|nr:cysteine hydrolase [Oscillospiraceae bacterium]
MQNKALVVIDIQNDITKHYKEIVAGVNKMINWAVSVGVHVVYIRHENLSAGTRTFKTGTKGAELVTELNIVSDNIFTKYKGNALSSDGFRDYIAEHEISSFLLVGADAIACVKSTCYNMRKAGFEVTVISDCVTSYDKNKIQEMLGYYSAQGCIITTVAELIP